VSSIGLRLIPLLLVALVSVSPVQAQELRIGYVDTARVMEEAPQGVAVDERLRAEFSPREKDLLEKQTEIADLETELEEAGSDMTSARRRKLEREIRLRIAQYKYEEQEFREDRNLRRNEAIRGLQKIVYDAIVEIAESDGYDLVLTNGVSYASSRTDLTDAVIDKLKGQQRASESSP
jgi:outer membrane protein